jgi:MFS family permease
MSRSPNERVIVVGLALAFFNFTGANAVRVLLTLYVLELGAPASVVGVLGGLLYLFPLLLSWPIGIWADRTAAFGLLMFAAVVAFVSVMLIYAFPVLPVFYVAAALNGLALAFYHVTLQTLVGTMSRPEDRARNFANFSLVGAMTSFAGPLLAGFAIDSVGFAWASLMIAALSLVVVLLLLVFGRHLPRPQPSARDTAAPSMQITRAVAVMLVISGLVQLGYDLFQFYVPIHGHAVGLSASAIGSVLAVVAVSSFIARFFMPHLVRRMSTTKLLVGVFCTGAAGLALVPFTDGVLSLSVLAFLFGLGMGIGIPLTTLMMYEGSPKGRSGQTLGMRLTSNNLVRMSGPMVFGVLAAALGLNAVFYILGALMIGGAVMSLRR